MNSHIEIWTKEIKKRMKKRNAIKSLKEYQEIIIDTENVDEATKEEGLRLCDIAIDAIEREKIDKKEARVAAVDSDETVDNEEELDEDEQTMEIDGDDIDFDDTVLDDERYVETKANKNAIIASALGLAAVLGITVWAVQSCEKKPEAPKDNSNKTEATTSDEETKKELKEGLAFDPEDTDVMITNIDSFLDDSLTKGLKLNEESLDSELEAFVDFYKVLNIDEIGAGSLAGLYQSDNKSYIDMINNYISMTMRITDEAMMSTVEEDNVINIKKLVANEEEAEVLQNVFNLLAKINSNTQAKDMEALKANTTELHTILEETLTKEEGAYHSFSASSKVFIAYSAMNADLLLQNVPDISILTDDERKIMYEDSEIGCAMLVVDKMLEYRKDGKKLTNDEVLLLVEHSEANTEAVSLIYQIEKKVDQMVMLVNMDSMDYSDETNISEVIKLLKAGLDLSMYKPNQEYTDYNNKTYDLYHPAIEVPENSIIINDGNNFVAKEELDKYDVDTNGKTSEQVQNEYQQAVKDEQDSEYKKQDNITNNSGKPIHTGADSEEVKEDVEAAYELGFINGRNDAQNGKAYNDSYNGTEAEQAMYKEAYKKAYNETIATKESAKEDVTKETEILDKPIESPDEVIGSGTEKQPEPTKNPIVIEETVAKEEETTKQPETTTQPTEDEKYPVLNEEVIDEGIYYNEVPVDTSVYEQPTYYVEQPTTEFVSEEVVVSEGVYVEEETTVMPGITSVQLENASLNDLYNMYYEYMFGTASDSMTEEKVMTKAK